MSNTNTIKIGLNSSLNFNNLVYFKSLVNPENEQQYEYLTKFFKVKKIKNPELQEELLNLEKYL